MFERRDAPEMVMTWAPEFVPSPSEPARPGWVPCNKTTPPHARGVIYEHVSRGGRGIVAVCDFGGSTGVPHPTFRYAGWAQLTLLDRPVSRERLLADPALSRVFGNLQGPPRPLSSEQSDALGRLLGHAPGRLSPRTPTARERRSVLTDPWRPAHDPGGWVNEAEIENRLAADRHAWRKLGFGSEPATQARLNPRDRPDLLGDGAVAEVKLDATAADLPQLHRYLRWLDANRPLREPWRGLLITGAAVATPALLAAVAASPVAIELWSCRRRPRRSGVTVRRLAATRA